MSRPRTSDAGTVQSVQRAIAVLNSFKLNAPEHGVSELAAAHGVHPSSMSRLLGTLMEGGLVRMNAETGRYRLGLGVLELATVVRQSLDIRAAALPVMRELALATGDTVNLAILDQDAAVVVEQAPGPGPFIYASWVGRRLPLHSSAHGRVHLAAASPDERVALMRRLAPRGVFPRHTPETLTTLPALQAEIDATVRRGYAVSRGEHSRELGTVAVAIVDDAGKVVASLSTPEPVSALTRAREDELAKMLLRGSAEISKLIGRRSVKRPLPPRKAIRRAKGAA